jgi:hypothetical protein
MYSAKQEQKVLRDATLTAALEKCAATAVLQ